MSCQPAPWGYCRRERPDFFHGAALTRVQEHAISTANFVSKVNVSIVIAAAPARVLRAFFDRGALAAWWQAAASVTTPRVLGPYAVEWRPTDFRDEVLGRLGGVLRGTVIQIDPAAGFFLADVYWLPPDGDPIGPMAIEVTCHTVSPDPDRAGPDGGMTEVRILQTGFEDSARWRRYYAVFSVGWERALVMLKALLER
ncbi:MAG: SRPBCC domain-containing protein [Acidimicrobiia bacterium]|nr:SRPBCC domain-containing protein [Acidimicrobiia bacterium]